MRITRTNKLRKWLITKMILLFCIGLPLGAARAADVAYLNSFSNWDGYGQIVSDTISGQPNIGSIAYYAIHPASDYWIATYITPPYGSVNFQQYDVIILDRFESYYESYRHALGDKLADYLDAGGKLIIKGKAIRNTATAPPIGGRLFNEYIEPYINTVGLDASSGPCNSKVLNMNNPPTDTDHPLMRGVTGYTDYSIIDNLTSGRLLSAMTGVAQYTNGSLALIVNDAETIVFMNTNYGTRPGCTGDMGKLFDNAVGFLVSSIIPGTPQLELVETGPYTEGYIESDYNPSDGTVGARIGAWVQAIGHDYSPGGPEVTEESEITAYGSLPFTVGQSQQLFFNATVCGVLGGNAFHESTIEVQAVLKNADTDETIRSFAVNRSKTGPWPGIVQVDEKMHEAFAAAEGISYVIEIDQRVYATATFGGSSASANFLGSSVAAISSIELPAADAGDDQTVTPGTLVTLDGSGSSAGVTYKWTQVDGEPVTLSDGEAESPTFTPDEIGLYGFELVVTKGGVDSLPDRVNVLVAGATPVRYELTVNTDGQGTVTLDPAPVNGGYDEGTGVTLTATPDPGWQFDGWTGDVIDPDSAVTAVIMTSDKQATAHFVEKPPSPPPSGGGAVGTAGSGVAVVPYGCYGGGYADPDGNLQGTVEDDTGRVLAEVSVTGAEPNEYFHFGANDAGAGIGDVPGPWSSSFAGFAGDVGLGRRLRVETSAPPGSFVVTVSMTFTAAELAALGIDFADVELHVFNEDTNTWEPAGSNLGASAPTGVVGDSGYLVNPDGSVTFWTVRDELSYFAAGAPGTAEPEPAPLPEPAPMPAPQPQPEPDAGQQIPQDQGQEIPQSPPPVFCPFCGPGMVQCLLASFVGLMAMQNRRRR